MDTLVLVMVDICDTLAVFDVITEYRRRSRLLLPLLARPVTVRSHVNGLHEWFEQFEGVNEDNCRGNSVFTAYCIKA